MGEFCSIHLKEFPKVNFKIDEDIVNKMDKVREVCNAVFSLRKEANLRVRMPLKKVVVFGGLNLEEQYISIIKQEVNTKEVEDYCGSINDVASEEVVLNLKECGKVFGSKLKTILDAQRKKDWKILENGELLIANEKIDKNLFEIVYKTKDGQKTFYISRFNLLVAIEASNDVEFIIEGLARDVIRMIQQTRKDEGLEISDKIEAIINTKDEIFKDVIEKFDDYIKDQTLANNIEVVNNIDNIEDKDKYNIDGYCFAVSIKRI